MVNNKKRTKLNPTDIINRFEHVSPDAWPELLKKYTADDLKHIIGTLLIMHFYVRENLAGILNVLTKKDPFI